MIQAIEGRDVAAVSIGSGARRHDAPQKDGGITEGWEEELE